MGAAHGGVLRLTIEKGPASDHIEGPRAWPQRSASRLITQRGPASDHREGPRAWPYRRATENDRVPEQKEWPCAWLQISASRLATDKGLAPGYREGKKYNLTPCHKEVYHVWPTEKDLVPDKKRNNLTPCHKEGPSRLTTEDHGPDHTV